MEKINYYEDLQVWQKAHKLVLEIYEVTKKFPQAETFGLTSQIRRAAVSIAANIAEGHCRKYNKEFVRFLIISSGSTGEVRYYLKLANDLKYITEDEYNSFLKQIIEISKMLNGLVKSLKKVHPNN